MRKTYCQRGAVSAFVIAFFLRCGCSAYADDFPNKPIRIIVPFTAGGAIDIVARTVTQRVGENLGVPTVIENRAGAGGNVGAIVAVLKSTIVPVLVPVRKVPVLLLVGSLLFMVNFPTPTLSSSSTPYLLTARGFSSNPSCAINEKFNQTLSSSPS